MSAMTAGHERVISMYSACPFLRLLTALQSCNGPIHCRSYGRPEPQQHTGRYSVRYSAPVVTIVSDILCPCRPGLPKALEYFYYFQITNAARFKTAFKDFVLPKINTSSQLVNNKPPSPRDNPNHPFRGLNVAFSSLGLTLFGIDPSELGDDAFLRGQLADARSLGDAGAGRGDSWSPDWDPEFKANIHGLFIITAYNEPNAQSFIQELEAAFKWSPMRSSIKKILNFHCWPRPGANGMNDAFGWRGGGFSNPQVKGVTFMDEVQYTGTPVIPMGVIVIGREGDEDASKRPGWAKDGSLIATRKLNCLVPEFETYLAAEAPKLFPNLSRQAAIDKLGSRLMGRWKNGECLSFVCHVRPELTVLLQERLL